LLLLLLLQSTEEVAVVGEAFVLAATKAQAQLSCLGRQGKPVAVGHVAVQAY
jgi:hypothetical protein